MTKKFPYNFLRFVFILIFFSISLSLFSQSNVYINVNWVSYSGENKIEIINSSNSVVLSYDHNYGTGSNTSHLNQNSNTVSLPNGNYTVRVYDNYGDDWNGSGSYGKIFVGGTEEFNFDGNFSNNASANTEITFDYSLTIGSIDDASFTYASSSYSITDSDPTPNITGESGGTFSSTSGLSLNTTTGAIDVSASTIGNYVVTYTTTAPDQNSATFNIAITAGSVPGVAEYYSNNNSFPNNIEYIPGNLPIIISAPHGGKNVDGNLITRNCGVNEEDNNTDILIRIIQKEIFDLTGGYPHIIINNLSRSKLDPNRNKTTATCNNSATNPYFDAYHAFIDKASTKVTADYGKGIYIDLHGQSHTPKRIDVGFNISTGTLDAGTLNNSITTSTIQNLKNNNLGNLTLEQLVRGTSSFGHFLQTTGGSFYNSTNGGAYKQCGRTSGYRAVPSSYNSGGCNDTTPNGSAYFAGDYYSNIRHGSGPAASESTAPGNTIGGGGVVDGMMTEVNRDVRHLGNLTAEYNRSDSKPQTIVPFGKDYAAVILKFIEAHYNDFSKFSFASNSHSIYGADVTPSVNGILGGTFSSTSGLSINSSTGVIDVSNSTPGTYTVSYVGANVNNYYKKENQITINSDAVTNELTSNSGNWSLASNWSLNRVPIATDNVLIPTGKTINVGVNNALSNNVSVSGTLHINAGKSLTVNGNLTTTGTTKITSNATTSGSLIVNGSSTGNIIYERYIKDNSNWFMVSSPLENQDIDAFVSLSANAIASGSNNNRGLSHYNNANKTWGYYQDGTTTSGSFILGDGRAVRRTSAGVITFTGNLKTDDDVMKYVTYGADGWNLVGNSFTSFLNVNDPADNTNNIIDINFDLLDSGYKAVYFWDTATKAYKPFNNSSNAAYVSPGQGFFVKVNANGNLLLNENMQSHQSADLFLRGGNSSNKFEIDLKVSNGKSYKNTEVKYIKGTTTGLDDGYDAGLFSSDATFDVYTHLVTDDNGTKYAIQALPDVNYSNMIIPVGVNAVKNSTITFTADIINIPANVNVVIEDKVENKFFRLDEKNVSYKVTLSENLNGIGRFFLHTSNSTLSIENDLLIDNISIFKNGDKLVVKGLKEESNIKLYSLLGKRILEKKLSNKLQHEFEISKLSKGVYLIEIETKNLKTQRKIVLE